MPLAVMVGRVPYGCDVARAGREHGRATRLNASVILDEASDAKSPVLVELAQRGLRIETCASHTLVA